MFSPGTTPELHVITKVFNPGVICHYIQTKFSLSVILMWENKQIVREKITSFHEVKLQTVGILGGVINKVTKCYTNNN